MCRLRSLIGAELFPRGFNDKLDGMQRNGTTMKVNLALKDLPRFTCLPEKQGQHNTTIHLLPDESEVEQAITDCFRDVEQGRLPDFPTIVSSLALLASNRSQHCMQMQIAGSSLFGARLQ